MTARAVALLGAVAIVLALPLGAHADRTLVVRLTSVTTSLTPHDVAPSGFSAGDRYFAKSRLLNRVPQFGKPKGAVVGSDQGTLTVLSATVARSVGVATLPGGTIRFRGSGKVGARTSIPIVGGTGDYAGARGTLVVSQAGDTTFNTYNLKLPGSA
jgi:hypothetical protein